MHQERLAQTKLTTNRWLTVELAIYLNEEAPYKVFIIKTFQLIFNLIIILGTNLESRESIRSNDYEELANVKNKSIAPKLTITKEQSRPTSSSLSVDSNNDNNYLKLPEIDKSQCYYPKIVNNNNYYDESSSLIKNDNKLKIKTFTDKSISALSLNHKTKLNDRASRQPKRFRLRLGQLECSDSVLETHH